MAENMEIVSEVLGRYENADTKLVLQADMRSNNPYASSSFAAAVSMAHGLPALCGSRCNHERMPGGTEVKWMR
jgi:hypothetical protein